MPFAIGQDVFWIGETFAPSAYDSSQYRDGYAVRSGWVIASDDATAVLCAEPLVRPVRVPVSRVYAGMGEAYEAWRQLELGEFPDHAWKFAK